MFVGINRDEANEDFIRVNEELYYEDVVIAFVDRVHANNFYVCKGNVNNYRLTKVEGIDAFYIGQYLADYGRDGGLLG